MSKGKLKLEMTYRREIKEGHRELFKFFREDIVKYSMELEEKEHFNLLKLQKHLEKRVER